MRVARAAGGGLDLSLKPKETRRCPEDGDGNGLRLVLAIDPCPSAELQGMGLEEWKLSLPRRVESILSKYVPLGRSMPTAAAWRDSPAYARGAPATALVTTFAEFESLDDADTLFVLQRYPSIVDKFTPDQLVSMGDSFLIMLAEEYPDRFRHAKTLFNALPVPVKVHFAAANASALQGLLDAVPTSPELRSRIARDAPSAFRHSPKALLRLADEEPALFLEVAKNGPSAFKGAPVPLLRLADKEPALFRHVAEKAPSAFKGA